MHDYKARGREVSTYVCLYGEGGDTTSIKVIGHTSTHLHTCKCMYIYTHIDTWVCVSIHTHTNAQYI
jgi:hypothetical protein